MKLCPSDACPQYVRFGTRGEYRDDVALCGECGAELAAVTQGEADENLRQTRPQVAWLKGALVAIAAGAIATGAVQVVREVLPSDVHFVNGLERTVTVRVDDEELLVGPHDRETVALAGEYELRVSSGGELLEAERIEVPRGTDLVVYNIMGAADLCMTTHRYVPAGQSPIGPFGGPGVERLEGRRFIVADEVDFVFEPAPQEVSTSEPVGLWEDRREFNFCSEHGFLR